jgi:acyl-CoA synthetase (AMP-forming)/AMP-acid ligase II
VDEVAVVGLPDDEFGQIVGAIVVPAGGASLSEDALSGYVKERLAYFKVPSRWVITPDALPRTATGKVVRAEVMDWFKEQ